MLMGQNLMIVYSEKLVRIAHLIELVDELKTGTRPSDFSFAAQISGALELYTWETKYKMSRHAL